MSVRRHYHCWSHTPIHAPISWALPPANVMVRKPPSSGSSSCSASASVSCSPVVSSTRSAQATSAHTLSLVPSFRTRIEIASPMVSRRGVGSSFEVPTSNVVARQANPNLMIPLAHSLIRYVLTPVHRTGHIEQEHRLLASLSSVCDTNPSSVVGR